MFAFGTKRAQVGLEQEGFAGAVDITKESKKEDFCTVSNCPPRHGGSVRRRVCERPNSDFDLQQRTCIIREHDGAATSVKAMSSVPEHDRRMPEGH